MTGSSLPCNTALLHADYLKRQPASGSSLGSVLPQDEGVHVFTVYVRNLIAERAREEYSALVESTGDALGQLQCVLAVTHTTHKHK